MWGISSLFYLLMRPLCIFFGWERYLPHFYKVCGLLVASECPNLSFNSFCLLNNCGYCELIGCCDPGCRDKYWHCSCLLVATVLGTAISSSMVVTCGSHNLDSCHHRPIHLDLLYYHDSFRFHDWFNNHHMFWSRDFRPSLLFVVATLWTRPFLGC